MHSTNGTDVRRRPGRNGSAAESHCLQARPYKNDLEYLQCEFERIRVLVELYDLRCGSQQGRKGSSENVISKEKQEQELRDRLERRAQACRERLRATEQAGTWRPRVEGLVEQHGLDPFERDVILLLAAIHVSPSIRGDLHREPYVEDVLEILEPDLERQIACRRYFYRSSRLVKSAVVQVEVEFGNLGYSDVVMDGQMIDYVLGLDTESSQLVAGSNLYNPSVDLEQVILPEHRKRLVLETVEHFEAFRAARRELGLDESLQYGRGVTLLFYGPPGTGKTMLANALARHVGKRLLLVNFPIMNTFNRTSEEILRFLFREAQIQDAVLFFDECESVFVERDPTILTELERYDGLVVMATNRPHELDEAMHRRITLAVAFEKPDAVAREAIWRRLVPEQVDVALDVDPHYLAERYALTGGLIKNAVLYAVSRAAARSEGEVMISQHDLETGAKHQLRGILQMSSFENQVVPKRGLDDVVLSEALSERLQEVVALERSRHVLMSRWGFGEDGSSYRSGTILLFHGPPGTGKTMTAEALGYELGRPLRVVTPAEVHSMWVGETSKTLESIFDEATAHGAILLLDEADALISGRTDVRTSTDRFANADVNTMLRLLESFDGVAILTTNLLDNLDPAVRRRVRYALEFTPPDENLRRRLWRQLMPSGVPLADDVDLDVMAARFTLSGAGIRNTLFRAAARTAARPEAQRIVDMEDLMGAAAEEAGGQQREKTLGFTC